MPEFDLAGIFARPLNRTGVPIQGLLKFEELDRRFIEVNIERLGLRAQWKSGQPPQ